MMNTTTTMTSSIQRMCISTREIKNINDLFRVVKTPSGNILIEEDKHLPGRGAYISRNIEAIKIAQKKKLLNKALRTNVPDSIYEQLLAMC